jgi:hypothetical protein
MPAIQYVIQNNDKCQFFVYGAGSLITCQAIFQQEVQPFIRQFIVGTAL